MTSIRSGDCLVTVTPMFRTSSGNRGWAMATRFCTSTCAVSRSVPSLNVTASDMFPSPVDCEVMYSMLSTPLTSCSIGVATVLATISAEAPGYCAVTEIDGGAMSGYCATGRAKYATPPTSVMMMEITAAKIGRSMKKCEMFMRLWPRARLPSWLLRYRSAFGRALLGRDLLPRTRAQKPDYDHVVVLGDPAPDDAQIAVDHRAELDRLRHHGAVRRHGKQELGGLVGHHGSVGHKHDRMKLRHWYPNAAELPRRDEVFGVGEGRAHADGASGRVIRIVDEIDDAFHRPVSLVHELALHLDFPLAGVRDLTLGHEALVGHAVGLTHIEEEMDGIERDDCGEQRRRAGGAADHQIADAELMAAGAAGDRRRHPRVVEIELRLVEARDCRVARSRRRVHLGHPLVIGFFRGVALLSELGSAAELSLGEVEIGVGLGEIGLGRFERELERFRLDDKEQVALLDDLPVDEIDRFEIAAHPGADVDEVDRLELAGEILPLDHLSHDRLGHRHRRGRRRRRSGLGRLEEAPLLPDAPIAIKQDGKRGREQQKYDAANPLARPRRLRGLAHLRRRLFLRLRWQCSGAIAAPLAARSVVVASLRVHHQCRTRQ